MTVNAPDAVTRYLAAADEQNAEALAACFTADGTVLDEGHTYTGPDEIIGWRKDTASKWTYTSELTASEAVSADEYRITVHLEGDFPGGVVDLHYKFVLRDGLIAALSIVE
jgi:ketosteroid isomerase-like protein